MVVLLATILIFQKSEYPYDITASMMENFFDKNFSLMDSIYKNLQGEDFENISIKYQGETVLFFSSQEKIETPNQELVDLCKRYLDTCKKANMRNPSVLYSNGGGEIRFTFFFYLDSDQMSAATSGYMNSQAAPIVQEKEGNFMGNLGGNWYYYRYAHAKSPGTTNPFSTEYKKS